MSHITLASTLGHAMLLMIGALGALPFLFVLFHWCHAYTFYTRMHVQYFSFLLEDKDSILGWLSFESFKARAAYDKTVEISIYVKEEARGKGAGISLIENAFNECKRLNIYTLTAFIFGHNEPSCKMVEKLGFEKWGFLPNIASFEGGERDLVIYGKRIQ